MTLGRRPRVQCAYCGRVVHGVQDWPEKGVWSARYHKEQRLGARCPGVAKPAKLVQPTGEVSSEASRHAVNLFEVLSTREGWGLAEIERAFAEALASQEEELRSLREQVKAAGKFADPEYRDAYISEASRDVLDACAAKQQAEDACERLALEVRSLREERDAAMEVLSGGRLYGPDASGEFVEQPTTLLERAQHVASAAETEADIVDDIRAERDVAKARAESAEADARLQKEIADAYAFERDTAEAEVKRLRERR